MVFGINYQKGIIFHITFYSYSVQDQISGGCNGTVKETPKENSPVFKKCVYTLVGNNDQSLDVSAAKAKELGYNPVVLYSGLEGEATEMANKLVTDDPNSKLAWFMKGAIELNVKKDYKSAIESCDKALAIDPNYKDALFNKGTAYINDIYDQTHGGKKFQYIGTNRRITGKASDGSYKKNKAIYDKEVAYVKGYYENALKCMERVRELAPEDAKRWAPSLQMVYSALGQKDKAKEMDELLDAANHSGK